ncbi:MAG: methylglyoxal synthase, partial [Cyanobacteria bacterium P01_F01_bin.42]
MPICVALIAHDSQKDNIVVFAKKYRAVLSRYSLIATNETGQMIAEATGLAVERVASGIQGGMLQIAARIIAGEVVGVIFLMDPLSTHAHEPDRQALQRICNLYDVPLATNMATAELSIQGVAKRQEAYLIFNPVAGQGNPDRDLATIRQILEPQVNL